MLFFVKKIFVKKNAFTLVELLVTLSIIMIFMSGTIIYNKTTNQQMALFREEGNIIAMIQKAKSLAVSTFSVAGDEIPCGYGIHMFPEENKVIIFKEIPGPSNSDCTFFQGNFYNEEEKIEELKLKEVFLSANFNDILFIPPDPSVYSNIDFSQQKAEIVISSPRGGDLSFNINKFGQISVMDQD